MGRADVAVAVQACPHDSVSLGRVAFIRQRELIVFDLDSCTERVLARNVGTPIQVAWSADGNWLAVGNRLISAADGRVARPFGRLPTDENVGVWAPRGHELARITARGGLVLGGPDSHVRQLLPDGWGADDLMFASDGTLAVSRDLRSGSGVGQPHRQEIWLLRVPALRPQLLYRGPQGRDAPPRLAAVARGGGAVFFWPFVDHANSANLDGLPLELVTPARGLATTTRQIVPWMLARTDFLSWCGSQLVAAAGFDRIATLHKSLIVAAAPKWSKRTLEPAGPRSWITPSCSPDGRLVAAAAGPNRDDTPFGREARSIVVVSLDGHVRARLAEPPRGESDELPRWSRGGRFILFVRAGSTSKNAAAEGRLYLAEAFGAHHVYGPLTRLGVGGNYYGQYGWNWDWYRPPVR
ncbi:MAG TPA: hypothetical protein VFJ93_00775 [Gaiellaceae bacterium]|nr:hypothetical protein [Gaiellaceae bacterium]